MKKIRFNAREFAESIKLIQNDPFVGDLAPRFERGNLLGMIGAIYPSRTNAKLEYRCVVTKDPDEGWMGMCSCRGWSQAKNAKGDAKPCVHIVDNLIRQPNFRMEDEVGVEAMKEEEERAAKSETRAKKKVARVQSDLSTVGAAAPVDAEDEEAPEKGMKLWASRMPLLVACPASNVQPGECLIIRESNQAASLGTIVHKAAEKILAEGLTEPPDMAGEIFDVGLTDPQMLKDLPGLLWSVVNEWHGREHDKRDPLKAYFQTLSLEERFTLNLNPKHPRTGEKSPISVTAILDFNGASAMEGRWLIADWKTNRKEDEPFYSEQMKMEAAALMANKKEADSVTVLIIWLRHGTRTIRTYTRLQIREWLQMLVKRKFFWDGTGYNTGDHCQYCPRVYVCEGRKTKMRSYMNILGDVDTEMLLYDDQGALLVPDEMLRRQEVCKAFRKIDKAYNDALKELLVKSGPRPLVEQPGFALGIKEKQGGIKISVEDAWTTFLDFLTPDQITPFLSITKAKLEEAISGAVVECETCPEDGTECPNCKGMGVVPVYKGAKGKTIAGLIKRLEDCGAATHGAPSKEIAVISLKETPAILVTEEETND